MKKKSNPYLVIKKAVIIKHKLRELDLMMKAVKPKFYNACDEVSPDGRTIHFKDVRLVRSCSKEQYDIESDKNIVQLMNKLEKEKQRFMKKNKCIGGGATVWRIEFKTEI